MKPNPISYPSILIGAFTLAGGMLFFLLGGLWLTRPTHGQGLVENAIITIFPAPSTTTISTNTPPISLTATNSSVPTALPGTINIGTFIQIIGTAGEGLRLRDEPGLGNTILTMASDAEVFQVLEGPTQADGYDWWYISDPYNQNRRGWAAANYLAVIQKP